MQQLRAQPIQAELARCLDGLDAWGALEAALAARPPSISWGPQAVSGMTPAPWVGSVIWQRGSGYTGYKTLLLVGIWALAEDDQVRLIVGHKALPYAAAFYEAEAYHQLMRSGFTVYYHDDGAPPPAASRRYDGWYVPAERLEQRAALRQALLSLHG